MTQKQAAQIWWNLKTLNWPHDLLGLPEPKHFRDPIWEALGMYLSKFAGATACFDQQMEKPLHSQPIDVIEAWRDYCGGTP